MLRRAGSDQRCILLGRRVRGAGVPEAEAEAEVGAGGGEYEAVIVAKVVRSLGLVKTCPKQSCSTCNWHLSSACT